MITERSTLGTLEKRAVAIAGHAAAFIDRRFALLLLLVTVLWSIIILQFLGFLNPLQGRFSFLLLLVLAGLDVLGAVLIAEWMGIRNLFTIDQDSLAHVEKEHPYLPQRHHIAATISLTLAIVLGLWQIRTIVDTPIALPHVAPNITVHKPAPYPWLRTP